MKQLTTRYYKRAYKAHILYPEFIKEYILIRNCDQKEVIIKITKFRENDSIGEVEKFDSDSRVYIWIL